VGLYEVIVADTHALIWWIGSTAQLSPAARAVLDVGRVSVPSIVCFEVALLARRRRVDLSTDPLEWLERLFQLSNVVLVPITPIIAVLAASLPDPIRDPADRLIVATALHLRVPFVTKDARICEARVVETIW
jgi:PIN domain nuclease of toxin-antitoxin system